ncbi:MAG: LamG-like jellyroll fold domain-containing protein [Bacteroidota bacterium]
MKTIIYTTIILLVGLLIYSCEGDEDLQEYPGNIIIIGSTYLNLHGTDTNDSNARMYAFSGSSETDLSSMSGEDWTYELWVKADTEALVGDRNAASGLTAGGASISERQHIFELYLIDDNDADFAIKYGCLQEEDNLQAASMQSNESPINLSFDEWFHVAISRSSSDGVAKFYINGILIDSSADPIWIQAVNDTWLDFNYMYRGGSMNFFKGSMENIRVSKIDRYPTEFTPDINTPYGVDEYTLLQLNLDRHLTAFDPPNDFDKIEILGTYEYYIKIHKDFTSWDSDIIDEYPVTGY